MAPELTQLARQLYLCSTFEAATTPLDASADAMSSQAAATRQLLASTPAGPAQVEAAARYYEAEVTRLHHERATAIASGQHRSSALSRPISEVAAERRASVTSSAATASLPLATPASLYDPITPLAMLGRPADKRDL
jgi:hypothetical protein